MSNFEKSMDEIFDVATKVVDVPHETKIVPVAPPPVPETGLDLTNDLTDAYEQTKSNLQDVIEQGKEALEDMLRIARESEHPRAFEVYGTLLKNMVDANKELLSVQKQMRDMDKNSKGGSTTIDKAAFFIGSTSELNKLIKGK